LIDEIIGVDTKRPVLLTTQGSVGFGGRNLVEEVRLVQALLNNVPAVQGGPTSALAVDGKCGPLTIGAIQRFQRAKLGMADGVVDARNRTIRALVLSSIETGKPIPMGPVTRLATPDEVRGTGWVLGFPFDKLQNAVAGAPSLPIPQSPIRADARASLVGSASSGFGRPFTPSGWTIDNSVGSFDITIKDTGVYAATMEVFFDSDPSVRQRLKIAGVIKSFSPSGGPPFGADLALPSFAATQGKIIRGLTGFAPINAMSFTGVCGISFAGINAQLGVGGRNGVSGTLIQFQWIPAAPPGACLGFALMVGVQVGVPGASAGGGTGVCVPL